MSSSERSTWTDAWAQALSQAPTAVKPGRGASAYSGFIPREELHGFASWTPDSFVTPPGRGAAFSPESSAAPPAPPEPSTAEREALARSERERARQSGYEDGYRDGLVGLENFKQSHARQMSAQIGQLVANFDREFGAMEQQLADAVARIATQLARQIVRSELGQRPGLVAAVATEAVNAVLLSARNIRVLVHPDDLDLVAQGAAEVLAARGARLVGDPAVDRGGCLGESDAGSVDARIQARWEQATLAMATGQDWAAP